jgi:hypothetical protein
MSDGIHHCILNSKPGEKMRYLTIAVLLATFTLLFIEIAPSANRHAVPILLPHPLDYVESSSGLDDPEWEGGRTELEMADVDDDGNVDIISIGDHGSPYINTNEHGIMVYFGDGAGSWSVFQNGNFGYGGVALGDVNNDGFMDAGYAMHHNYSSSDFGNQLIEVALGDGTGQNWTPWDDGLATNGETWGMFGTDFADVDNDGDLDLASDSFGASAGVHVYLNQGDGTWVQSYGFVGGNSSMDIVFGDVNSDGNADFAVAHQYGTVYIGDGSGGFTLSDGNLPPGGSIGRYGPDLGDVDNDGFQDLSFVNSNGGVAVWTWEGSSTWANASNGLPSSGGYEISQLCDMDVNGTMDLVAAGTGIVTVWKGDGSGNWSEAAEFSTPGSPGYINACRVGSDADNNGYPDIVLLDEEGPWYNRINHLRFFKEDSTPGSPGIRVTSPRRYETLKLDSVRFIEWTSAVPGLEDSTIDLDLSIDGTSGPWTTIAEDLPNNGRYQWTVSADAASADCHLRATVHTSQGDRTMVTGLPFQIIE